jgi:uncharacterized protein with PIN domain
VTYQPLQGEDLTLKPVAMRCRRCEGELRPGVAIGQTAVALRPRRGEGDIRTYHAGGTGKVIPCLKCHACGWSVSP